jgi:hypothetical protein
MCQEHAGNGASCPHADDHAAPRSHGHAGAHESRGPGGEPPGPVGTHEPSEPGTGGDTPG